MIKKFAFKALAMVASLGLSVAIIGCNAEEPPKPAPAPTPAPAVKPKTDEKSAPPAAVTPPAKEAAKTN